MKMQTVITALAAALFTVAAFADHNRTDAQGRKQGHWTEFPGMDGYPKVKGLLSAEGDYVDGKPHGHWVLKYVHEYPSVSIGSARLDSGVFGSVQEGPFVNGKQTGHWVLRFDDGTVAEGPMVNGKAHGKWVHRYSDGKVGKGPYVGGKMHGKWVERYASGVVSEGPYVNGERHGRWITRRPDGTETKMEWRNGLPQWLNKSQ